MKREGGKCQLLTFRHVPSASAGIWAVGTKCRGRDEGRSWGCEDARGGAWERWGM